MQPAAIVPEGWESRRMATGKDVSDPERSFEPVAYSRDSQIAIGSMSAGETASGRTFTHGFEGRLAELMESAITSRSLARRYLRAARRFVAAARRSRRAPDCSHYEAHLREARKAHDQARKCLSFARLCQQRAQCLAFICGYPPNPRG
jgi:hypothetical protein